MSAQASGMWLTDLVLQLIGAGLVIFIGYKFSKWAYYKKMGGRSLLQRFLDRKKEGDDLS